MLVASQNLYTFYKTYYIKSLRVNAASPANYFNIFVKTKTYTMKYTLLVAALVSLLLTSCGDTKNETSDNFDYNVTQFEDIKILRYQIPSWDNLTLKEQKLVYYLT